MPLCLYKIGIFVIGQIAVSGNGYHVAEIRRLRLEKGSAKILDSCQNLTGVHCGLTCVISVICVNTIGIQTKALSDVKRTV